jgi:hypothetical protein
MTAFITSTERPSSTSSGSQVAELLPTTDHGAHDLRGSALGPRDSKWRARPNVTEPTTRTLVVPGATLTYDVRVPDGPSDKRPLFVSGSPMGASGFEQLVGHFTDRTVITYDPRGNGTQHP